jgi:hypothetical protein
MRDLQTAIIFDTEAHEAPCSPEKRVEAVSHVAMIKRFCQFALTIGSLIIVAAGIVALKIVIWIPHFNR